MSVSDRIIKRMSELGLKQRDLVRLTGAKKGTVSQWVSGQIVPSNKFDDLLAKALQVSREYLLNGTDSDKSTVKEHQADYLGHVDAWDSSTPLNDDEAELPFFMDVELAAGIGGELAQENNGFKLRFSRSTLRKCGVDPSNAACVKVSGNSMEPRLYDGDVVGVDLGNKRIVDGKTYAINHDGLLRVKRLYRLPGGGIRINSMNTDEHPDELYSAEERDEINIIGRVFWHSSIWN